MFNNKDNFMVEYGELLENELLSLLELYKQLEPDDDIINWRRIK